MSERGRGAGPHGSDVDDDEPARESPAGGRSLSGSGSRPIAPYDPYRPPSVDAPRLPRDADAYQPSPRRPPRAAEGEPFLPEDDPLNAESWQLELDDAAIDRERGEDLLPESDRDTAPPPRPPRRQPDATRVGRDSTASATRTARKRRTAAASEGSRPSRPTISLSVPRAVAGAPLAADQVAVILLGVNAASFVLMALVLGIRLGGIASPAVLHLDAAGNPDRWGPPSVLWRLPLSSFFITLMALVVAWFLHPIDRFAARFALGVAVVAQVIAWVAVIQHIA